MIFVRCRNSSLKQFKQEPLVLVRHEQLVIALLMVRPYPELSLPIKSCRRLLMQWLELAVECLK